MSCQKAVKNEFKFTKVSKKPCRQSKTHTQKVFSSTFIAILSRDFTQDFYCAEESQLIIGAKFDLTKKIR